jgi:hypothetical protein
VVQLKKYVAKAANSSRSAVTVGYKLNNEFPQTGLPMDRPWVYPPALLLSKRFMSSSPAHSVLVVQPEDPAAPSLNVRWFYATDTPLEMPAYYKYIKKEEPKKFAPFSEFDSIRLETEYQKLLDGVGYTNAIPVNEDFLFEVNLEKRTMAPVYWEGAIYEVRRGTWFTNEGQPVTEKLAEQLENGYIRMKPYEQQEQQQDTKNPLLKKFEHETYTIRGEERVLYADEKSAYLLEKGYGGALQISYLKAVKSLPAIGAQLRFRGYQNPEVKAPAEESNTKSGLESLSSMMEIELTGVFGDKGNDSKNDLEPQTQKVLEIEIQQDYKADESTSESGRKIDHLIFCVHGIGQMLGPKFESVNFIHTVNVMRKNLKKAYSENKDFQELLSDKKNCRVQVLPISWRHKVHFNTTDDLSPSLPSLNDITVNEFKPLRNVLGSVLFDILLYYEPHYLKEIYDGVVGDANRQYAIFKERNQDFDGKVSIVGHSLGSAIVLDILSNQPDIIDPKSQDPRHFHFKVENYFGIGSPVGVFNLMKHQSIGPRSLLGPSTDFLKTLACENYYNIFHPYDPIGYRVEPLIRKEFKDYEPESVPFLIENFNKQLSYLAQVSDEFKNKMKNSAVSAWSNMLSPSNLSKFTESLNEEAAAKKAEMKKKVVELSKEQLETMTAMNYSGRVDYALQQGLLDLSMPSISAHVSYFEDENVAAFILKETMTKHDKVKKKTVITMEETKI